MSNRVGPFERVTRVRFGSPDLLGYLAKRHRHWGQTARETFTSRNYFLSGQSDIWEWRRAGEAWHRDLPIINSAMFGVALHWDAPQMRNVTQEALSAHAVWVVHDGRLYQYTSTGSRTLGFDSVPAAGVPSAYDDYPLATHHPALRTELLALPAGTHDLASVAPGGLEDWVATTLRIIHLWGEGVFVGGTAELNLYGETPLINYSALSEAIYNTVDPPFAPPETTAQATAMNNYAQGYPDLAAATNTSYWFGLPAPFVPAPGEPPPSYSASLGPSTTDDVGAVLRDLLTAEYDTLRTLTELPA